MRMLVPTWSALVGALAVGPGGACAQPPAAQPPTPPSARPPKPPVAEASTQPPAQHPAQHPAQSPIPARVPTQSPTPCVNRSDSLYRGIWDAELRPGALQYCTGDDCWALDLATRAFTALPGRIHGPPPAFDPDGTFTDGHDTTLATADATHVAFCPKGVDARAACRTFAIQIGTPAASVRPAMNDARTLGTVTYRGVGDDDARTWLLAFNLATNKRVALLEGSSIQPLDHGFLVDHDTFYSPAFKQVAKIAAPDENWVRLGSTDRIALRDLGKGEIVLQRTTTGQATRIPDGAPDVAYTLVASRDGATLYAIGTVSHEGEVVVVDVAKAAIVERVSPPTCAAGTHRLH